MLWSKIHRATVTGADVDYEGSLTIPPDLLQAASIVPYEVVQVWNVTRGTRLQTYAIEGLPGARDICANGAAAHKVRPGDKIIIAAFVWMEDSEIDVHEPKLVFVDAENSIARIGPEVPGPSVRGVREREGC